jgi:DNA invertase Pin-like site-specific DNA recombinase
MSDLSSHCLAANRVAIYRRTVGTSAELPHTLRRTVEDRGAVVVATYEDDAQITGRGKYAGWRTLIAHLDTVDQIVVSNAGDIPGKSVADLLKVLGVLRDRGVGLYLHDERIDTGSTGFALLALITAYRKAKLSQAIRNGQVRAVVAGKRIGRPIVPRRVQDRIRAALVSGGGVRPTARLFKVSPASVINIRRTMAAV